MESPKAAAPGPGLNLASLAALTVIATIAALLILLSLRLGLNGDVQYVLGSIRTSEPGGQAAPLDVFAHRPLVYRAFMIALDWIGATPVLDGTTLTSYERTLRLTGGLLSVAAATFLALGLRPFVGARQAATASLAVGAALVLGPAWNFMQPEWLAAVAVVVGMGLALWVPDARVAGAVAGLPLAVAFWAKLATLPYVLVGLLLIGLLDRRRSRTASLGAIAWTLILAIPTLLHPFELRWLRDIALLDLGEGIGTGENLVTSASALASAAAVGPILMVLPAAIVVLVRLAPEKGQWPVALVLTACTLLLIAPLVVQGKGYLYHLTGLPVLAAGLFGLSMARLASVALGSAVALAGASAAVALAGWWAVSQPLDWRAVNGGPVMLALAIGALALAILAVRLPLRSGGDAKPRATALLAVGLVVVLAFMSIPALAPGSAWSVDPYRTTATNATWTAETRATNRAMAGLREAIGPDTPVLYLAWGNVLYHLGNPTRCRYPAALFIRVLGRLHERPPTASFRENVDCIREGDEAWLVMDPEWIRLRQMRPGLRRLINDQFDCSRSLRAAYLLACPRRDGSLGFR